jgi:hypothetical protein
VDITLRLSFCKSPLPPQPVDLKMTSITDVGYLKNSRKVILSYTDTAISGFMQWTD